MATTTSLPPDRTTPAPSTLRVLVVDDDDKLRKTICDLLNESGFSVVGSACDGMEAVSLARELSPDVILLDMRMPNLDGLGAARLIRPVNPSVRFVMLSAYDDAALQHEARDIGVAAYLVKGCSLIELIEAIEA
jgi:DNA-binding NarL/FixJ family response regulator